MHLPCSNVPHNFCTTGLCYRKSIYIYYNILAHATGLSERHSATAECERSASELSETWLNEVNEVPSSLPGRVAEVVLSCGRLF